MRPSYANLFEGYVKHQFFNQYNGPKPELYGRYIDDCIGAISSSREELDQFMTSVNSFHPALKYTWEISETSLAFLDIKVSVSGNVLFTSVHYKPNEQPGTFKCAPSRCKTCLFIVNTSKISGPMRSVKITDRFTCTSAHVIYCITCALCNKFYIGETGRRLDDRFREHLCDVEKNDKDASKPVARHFNLPNHSKKHMAICGLSLHLGTTESRKNLEQKFIFQIGTLNPHGITCRFAIGYPPPQIQWNLTNPSSAIISKKLTLDILNVSRSQHGRYSCQACNDAGFSKLS